MSPYLWVSLIVVVLTVLLEIGSFRAKIRFNKLYNKIIERKIVEAVSVFVSSKDDSVESISIPIGGEEKQLESLIKRMERNNKYKVNILFLYLGYTIMYNLDLFLIQ